jgi:hypothetical protein
MPTKDRIEKYKAAGLCVNCGNRKPLKGHTKCRICLLRDRVDWHLNQKES